MLRFLQDCQVLPPDEIRDDLVRLGSRVLFDIDSAAACKKRIVADVRPTAVDSLSVVEPLGLALIGRKVGDIVLAPRNTGEMTTVMIHSVSNDNRREQYDVHDT